MNNSTDNKYVVVVTGPTGVGKSNLLLELFEDHNGPIISADSRQIYKEMSIGTAKPSNEEIIKLDLRLVDHVSIHEEYNASKFESEALNLIRPALEQGELPIVSGGTGLYLKAISEGLDDMPEVSQSTVDSLNKEAGEDLTELCSELKEKDPEYYGQIDIKNSRRIVRALSLIRETGRPFSSFLNQRSPREFKTMNIVLERPREELYARINERVMQMMERGLLDEVKGLMQFKEMKALQTVGYQELFSHLEGQLSLDESIFEIQKNTRRYAKRQMTWFRNQMDAHYFHPRDSAGMRAFIQNFV